MYVFVSLDFMKHLISYDISINLNLLNIVNTSYFEIRRYIAKITPPPPPPPYSVAWICLRNVFKTVEHMAQYKIERRQLQLTGYKGIF
jgi:hypothetical protein